MSVQTYTFPRHLIYCRLRPPLAVQFSSCLPKFFATLTDLSQQPVCSLPLRKMHRFHVALCLSISHQPCSCFTPHVTPEIGILPRGNNSIPLCRMSDQADFPICLCALVFIRISSACACSFRGFKSQYFAFFNFLCSLSLFMFAFVTNLYLSLKLCVLFTAFDLMNSSVFLIFMIYAISHQDA